MVATLTTVATVGFIVAGCAMYTLGTIGLLRFPDTRSRLHALTKADNLGLGLLVIGLSLAAGSVATVGLLILIWLLALAASATAAGLLARGGTETEPR
ncbi:monovalent cation/H(+) antiporter subunit G [Mycobacterium sp. SMC-4]|uniref:monovalent cation/H(+) antiporter subunit G n=1 Tax=Mycobacterium sp. SMC-4 TaxID=2857059 RepID=UPI0021B3EB01|nr:monovalent cation/H(+) antiporter subunit G [Mycobacterium sp. SMC-4]UXA20520.1 monovalent cation/H(+) antiporter subunit G [Mycobacterium sp. SMC-4]